jgi:hypothetical protein
MPQPEPLNALGWIFMIGSLAFVWGLTIWCFARVLAQPAPPPDEVKEFHSA